MTHIEGVNPARTERRVRSVLEAQVEKWGAPLSNHLLYARRPSIFRGARAMLSRASGRPPPSGGCGAPRIAVPAICVRPSVTFSRLVTSL
jgi:hypothetical protein